MQDAIMTCKVVTELLDRATMPLDNAWLPAAGVALVGDWLLAHPSTAISLRLDYQSCYGISTGRVHWRATHLHLWHKHKRTPWLFLLPERRMPTMARAAQQHHFESSTKSCCSGNQGANWIIAWERKEAWRCESHPVVKGQMPGMGCDHAGDLCWFTPDCHFISSGISSQWSS